MRVLPNVPRFLRVVGWSAVIVILINPVADRVGIKHWQPTVVDDMASIYAYQHREAAADVLFIGTSRTYSAVMPGEVESEGGREGLELGAFNLGQPATSLVASVMVLRDVLPVGAEPPRIVVLEVAPASVNANNGFTGRSLRHYSSLPDSARAMLSFRHAGAALEGLLRGAANLALLLYRPPTGEIGRAAVGGVVLRKGGLHEDSDERGPCDSVADWSPEQRRLTVRALRTEQRDRLLARYRIAGGPVAALEQAVALCRRRGARLLLVRYPEHVDYREMYLDGEDMAFEAFIHAFAAEHRVAYHDLAATMPLPESSFADLSHLNACGARELSRRITRELLVPVLGGRAGAS